MRLDYWDGAWGVRFSTVLEEFEWRARNDATNAGLSEDEYLAAIADRVIDELGGAAPGLGDAAR